MAFTASLLASFVESVRTRRSSAPEEALPLSAVCQAKNGPGQDRSERGHAESNDARLQMYVAARDTLLDAATHRSRCACSPFAERT